MKHLSEPLNGQRERRRIVHDLFRKIDFDLIVETGTYLGTTTEYLAAEFESSIYTIECNERFHAFAKQRLRKRPSVVALRDDSRSALRKLSSDSQATAATTFVYLDAHWQDDLPLKTEIDIVLRNWKRAVILIDDFAVPDDPGYAYDDYGPGAELNMELIRPLLGPHMTPFFPSAESSRETGYRRGCVVLGTPALSHHLWAVPSLRAIARQLAAAT